MNTKLVLCVVLALVLVCVCSESCDRNNCFATNGLMCNNQGTCECGTCKCDGEYRGPTCEECPDCPSVCEIYRHCVSCKVFMTGPYKFIECLDRCDNIMTPIPVYSKEDLNSFPEICKFVNNENCVESFAVGGMSGGYRDIYVLTQTECLPYVPPPPTNATSKIATTTTTETPSTTATSEETTTTEEYMTEGDYDDEEKDIVEVDGGDEQDDQGYKNKSEEAGPVSGSTRFQGDDNGSSSCVHTISALTLTILVVLSAFV